jgi:putative colanic acid biosynthesis acetyltransferase WcaF
MESDSDLITNKEGFVGPTFSLSNRVSRFIWQSVWLVAARWTPVSFHRWRIFLLRLFGASISYSAYVYPSVIIWAPWNLEMEDYATLAGGVNCYNIAKVTLKKRAIVSQFAFLCTGTHEYRDPAFPLVAKPIEIGHRAWICGAAFVGPGVSVGDGTVLAAASVAFRSLESWQVYVGNPAVILTARPMILDDN